MSKAAFSQADVTRAVKGIIAGGLPVVRSEISSDGSIRLWHTEAAAESDPRNVLGYNAAKEICHE